MEGNIDKIKTVIAFPLSLHMSFDKAKADGEVNLKDLPLLMEPAMKLIPMVGALGGVMVQIKDLSNAEKDTLNSWVKTTYDISDDALEKKIEGAVALALHVAQFLGVVA